MQEKRCSKCRSVKPLTEFYVNKSRKDGFAAACKPCAISAVQASRAKSPKRAAEINRRSKLKIKYGLTVETYRELLARQGDCCVGCGAVKGCRGQRLCVDHDHKTGRVRGLLCVRCNRAVGMARDNPEVLRTLADYLERT